MNSRIAHRWTRPSLALLTLALLPLVMVAGAGILFEKDVQLMTRDLAAVADVHPLTGALSSLGVLLWWTSASIWFFLAAVHPGNGAAGHLYFAASSGLLSAYLALDDLFQFHETLAPRYLGVSEQAVYAMLAIAVLFYLWRFWPLVVDRENPWMMLALALLVGSVVIDNILEAWVAWLGPWIYLVEDGAKWLGIVCWAAFAVVWGRGRTRVWTGTDSASLATALQARPPPTRTEPPAALALFDGSDGLSSPDHATSDPTHPAARR